MRDFLSKRVVSLEPSGIRKFFDIVSEMPDAISLGVGEPDFDTPWSSQRRRNFTHWSEAEPFIHRMQG